MKTESPTIRIAVISLGALALLCISLVGFLAYERVDIPDALSATAGGAVGALATLLTTFTPSPIPGGRRMTDQLPPASDAATPRGEFP